MHIGVIIPQKELGTDIGALRIFAQAAENLGYKYLIVFDVLLSDSLLYRCEPLVLFGFLAGCTQQIGLTTGVVIAPSRQTLLLAKQAASVDILSNGRLRLGLGIGSRREEYAAMQVDFEQRGARLEEQIALMRALWTQPAVTFQGQWHSLVEAPAPPPPLQRPIPLWLGGMTEQTLQRVARLADGWIPVGADPADPVLYDQLHEQVMLLQNATKAAGRSPETVGIDAQGGIRLRWGGEGVWALQASRWRALGATHLSVDTVGAGPTVEAHIEILQRMKQALGV